MSGPVRLKIVRGIGLRRTIKVYTLTREAARGAEGPPGPGLPAGGLIGQMIRKTASAIDYATEWFTATAATVGLGNVTNDAQLKRADDDFSGFSNAETLQVTDTFLTEQASAGGGAKRFRSMAQLISFLSIIFSSVFAPISDIVEHGTVATTVTIDSDDGTEQTLDFSADIDFVIDLTTAIPSVNIQFEVTGGALPDITTVGPTVDAIPTSQGLTGLVAGIYEMIPVTFNNGSSVTIRIEKVS